MHVGKSSWGWSFSFRGYRNEWDTPQITSYKDWLMYLEAALDSKEIKCELRDEEGDLVDLEDFKRMVEEKRGGSNHTIYCQTSHPEHAARDCWLDEEGNSFSDCEFS